jgi:cardiolipin synthase A/B
MKIQRAKTTAGFYTAYNQVKLLRGGASYFSALHRLIDEAQQIVHIQIYILEDDDTGTALATHLITAVQRGVQVYLVVDGYASRQLSEQFITKLKEAGVHFRWFNRILSFKTFYFGRRLHQKIAVADGLVSLVGGINISNRYNDINGVPAWLDWALYSEGEVCAELDALCAKRWAKAGYNIKSQVVSTKKTISTQCLVRVRRNDWVRRKTQITRSYLEMFARAQSEIIIMSSYFLPGRSFRKAIHKATERGVKLKIIVTGESDIQFSKAAERYWYNWLLKCKAEIYEYQPGNLHAKLSMYDEEWVTVGSYNVNDLSAYASIELNMDVKSKIFGQDVRNQLLEIIEKDCVQINIEAFLKKQRFFTRVKQLFSYEILRLSLFLFTFYFKQRTKG